MSAQGGSQTHFRSPVRISVTIPDSVHEGLNLVASEQGRSLSNLAAYLLEWALSNEQNCRSILHHHSVITQPADLSTHLQDPTPFS